jgi:hypothetical protein
MKHRDNFTYLFHGAEYYIKSWSPKNTQQGQLYRRLICDENNLQDVNEQQVLWTTLNYSINIQRKD